MKQLQQLDGLEVDFAGLNFSQNSPRYAGNKISKNELIDADLDIKKVGIFVNAGYDEIMEIVEEYGLDVVQLHGKDDVGLCERISEEIETIKAFKIDDKNQLSIDEMIEEYDEVCDYYLFDNADSDESIATKKFDWKKIASSKVEKPFFLAGAIGPTDATLVKKIKHPDYYGVDINDLFEKEPGLKDMSLILQFIHGLK